MVSTCWPTLRTSCATTAKPAPWRAGARAFCVQCQHLHLIGNVLNRPRFPTGDLVDLAGQARDQRGNVRGIGIVTLVCCRGRDCGHHAGHQQVYASPSAVSSIYLFIVMANRALIFRHMDTSALIDNARAGLLQADRWNRSEEEVSIPPCI